MGHSKVQKGDQAIQQKDGGHAVQRNGVVKVEQEPEASGPIVCIVEKPIRFLGRMPQNGEGRGQDNNRRIGGVDGKVEGGQVGEGRENRRKFHATYTLLVTNH